MVNSLIATFATVHQGRESDEMYQYWSQSLLKELKISKIPLTLVDENVNQHLQILLGVYVTFIHGLFRVMTLPPMMVFSI